MIQEQTVRNKIAAAEEAVSGLTRVVPVRLTQTETPPTQAQLSRTIGNAEMKVADLVGFSQKVEANMGRLEMQRMEMQPTPTMNDERIQQLRVAGNGITQTIEQFNPNQELRAMLERLGERISAAINGNLEHLSDQAIDELARAAITLSKAVEIRGNSPTIADGTPQDYAARAISAYRADNRVGFEFAVSMAILEQQARELPTRSPKHHAREYLTQEQLSRINNIITGNAPINEENSGLRNQLIGVHCRIGLDRAVFDPENGGALGAGSVAIQAVQEINRRLEQNDQNAAERLLGVLTEMLSQPDHFIRAQMEHAAELEISGNRNAGTQFELARSFSSIATQANEIDRIRRNWNTRFRTQSQIVSNGILASEELLINTSSDNHGIDMARALLASIRRYALLVDMFSRNGRTDFEGRSIESALAQMIAGHTMMGAQRVASVFEEGYNANRIILINGEIGALRRATTRLTATHTNHPADRTSANIIFSALDVAGARLANNDFEGALRIISYIQIFYGMPESRTQEHPARSQGWTYALISWANNPYADQLVQLRAAITQETSATTEQAHNSAATSFAAALERVMSGERLAAAYVQFQTYLSSTDVQSLITYERAHRGEITAQIQHLGAPEPVMESLLANIGDTLARRDSAGYQRTVHEFLSRLNRINEYAAGQSTQTAINQLDQLSTAIIQLRQASTLHPENVQPTRTNTEPIAGVRSTDAAVEENGPPPPSYLPAEISGLLNSLETRMNTLRNAMGRDGFGSHSDEYARILSDFEFARRVIGARNFAPDFADDFSPRSVGQARIMLELMQRLTGNPTDPRQNTFGQITVVMRGALAELETRRVRIISAIGGSNEAEISQALRAEYNALVREIANARRILIAYRQVQEESGLQEQYTNAINNQIGTTDPEHGVLLNMARAGDRFQRTLRELESGLVNVHVTDLQHRAQMERVYHEYDEAIAERALALSGYTLGIGGQQGTIDRAHNPSIQLSEFNEYRARHARIIRGILSSNQTSGSELESNLSALRLIEHSVLSVPLTRSLTTPRYIYPNDCDILRILHSVRVQALRPQGIESAQRQLEQMHTKLERAQIMVQTFVTTSGLLASLVPGIGAILSGMIFTGSAINELVDEYNGNEAHHISMGSWLNLGLIGAPFVAGEASMLARLEAEARINQSTARTFEELLSSGQFQQYRSSLGMAQGLEMVARAGGTIATLQMGTDFYDALASGNTRDIIRSAGMLLFPYAHREALRRDLASAQRREAAQARIQLDRLIADAQFRAIISSGAQSMGTYDSGYIFARPRLPIERTVQFTPARVIPRQPATDPLSHEIEILMTAPLRTAGSAGYSAQISAARNALTRAGREAQATRILAERILKAGASAARDSMRGIPASSVEDELARRARKPPIGGASQLHGVLLAEIPQTPAEIRPEILHTSSEEETGRNETRTRNESRTTLPPPESVLETLERSSGDSWVVGGVPVVVGGQTVSHTTGQYISGIEFLIRQQVLHGENLDVIVITGDKTRLNDINSALGMDVGNRALDAYAQVMQRILDAGAGTDGRAYRLRPSNRGDETIGIIVVPAGQGARARIRSEAAMEEAQREVLAQRRETDRTLSNAAGLLREPTRLVAAAINIGDTVEFRRGTGATQGILAEYVHRDGSRENAYIRRPDQSREVLAGAIRRTDDPRFAAVLANRLGVQSSPNITNRTLTLGDQTSQARENEHTLT